MNTVEIGGDQYPIRFDFTALKKVAQLAGKSSLAQLAAIGEGIQLEQVPELVQIGLERGLAREKDKRKTPTLEEIENELNDRLSLMNEALEILGQDMSGGKTVNPTEGN